MYATFPLVVDDLMARADKLQRKLKSVGGKKQSSKKSGEASDLILVRQLTAFYCLKLINVPVS